MKNKYFYVIISAAAFLMCFTGCNEGMAEKSSSQTAVKESSEASESGGESPTEATAVSTLTPLQTFLKITEIENTVTENVETPEAPETEKITEKNKEPSDQWFSAHTLFSMKMRGEEQEATEEDDKTWFRYNVHNETTVTKASEVKPGIKISEIKENNKKR